MKAMHDAELPHVSCFKFQTASCRICALFIAYYMCVLVNSFVSKLFEFELYSAEY